MTRNKHKKPDDGDGVRVVAGVRFVIDPMGFVRSSEGELGHIEDCRETAEFFAAFLDAQNVTRPPKQ